MAAGAMKGETSRFDPEGVLEALAARKLTEIEVYWKRGRHRHFQLGREGTQTSFSEEEGWAVRAGNSGGSFFVAGVGPPDREVPWPELQMPSIRLPEPEATTWRTPADLETSLLAESEGVALLTTLRDRLAEELPGARLLRASLDDGSSEVRLLSNRGAKAEHRHRLAAVRIWAAAGPESRLEVELHLAMRSARGLSPRALARRLVDRLSLVARGGSMGRERGEILLAPEVAVHLWQGLLPLFVGSEAWPKLRGLAEANDRLGSPALTLIDNGRLPGGLVEAPVDGEGVPTREVLLVDEGILRQPLLPWWHATDPGSPRVSGCRLRPSWRSLPRTGATHFFLQPEPERTVTDLLADLVRGFYFIDTAGAGRFDLEHDRFALPVIGFEVRSGRPTRPLTGVWLVGGIRALLRGVRARARDLTFLPLRAVIGSPTVLVTGVEVRDGR